MRSSSCSAALTLVAVVALLLPPGAAAADAVARVEQAVVELVRAEIDPAAEVQVVVGQVRLADTGADDLATVRVQPAPGARLTRPTRFTVYAGSGETAGREERIGYAVATVSVAMPHVRAARAVARGTQLAASDLVLSVGDIGAVPLEPLPAWQDAVGAEAVRAMRAGDLVSGRTIRPPLLVRRGDPVVTRVQVGAVTVTGQAKAQANGRLGDRVRLVNERSGKRLEGRVVAAGEVEVVQ